jgi:hypothetical protein
MKTFLVAGFCWSAILNAGAQGLTAKATAAGPSSKAAIKVLRQEASTLEARMHGLEKKADDAKNDRDDAAKEEKLDQRPETMFAVMGASFANKHEPGLVDPLVGFGDQAIAVGLVVMIRRGNDLITLRLSGVDEPVRRIKLIDGALNAKL